MVPAITYRCNAVPVVKGRWFELPRTLYAPLCNTCSHVFVFGIHG